MSAPRRELAIYIGRIRQFTRLDWLVYVAWVGLMLSLALLLTAFIGVGVSAAAPFPTEAFWVPAGAYVFTGAIAIDTIGHRTIYKEVLRGGEALVHHVIIFLGVSSCVLLCLGYVYPRPVLIPAAVLTILSIVYSLADEVMHWRRYLSRRSDRVEMWSHVFILIGHAMMMVGWWRCFLLGYPGVPETLQAVASLL